MNIKIILCLSLGLLIIPVSHAKRYALVIGNSGYQHMGVLDNPVNDAADMGKLLKKKKFEVTVLLNANQRKMEEAIRHFSNKLREKNSVGLFYFAGHGLAVDGHNYLIPVEVDIKNSIDIKYKGVDAGYVLEQMQAADNDLNMLILDACRNNPFKNKFRGVSRGLAPIQSAKGALILYAASLGELAADGNGRNGLFTTYLMQAINTPGLKVEDVFKTTAVSVNRANKEQLPWQSGVILGDFYFTINAPQAETVTVNTAPSNSNQAEVAFWNSIKDSHNKAYFLAYLDRYGEKGIYSVIARIKLKEIKTDSAKPKINQVHLIVKTSPDNSKIRILNIGPKYQPGMALKPKRYHIEVSHKGYQRHTEWIELKNEDLIHSVVLEEKPVFTKSIPTSTNHYTSSSTTESTSGIKMVSVPAGCFQMGSNEGGEYTDDEKPVHRVCLSAYKIGKYEVTQSQWKKVMGNNPSHFKGNNKPVEKVSWDDVQKFIRKLNQQTGQHYRLPSEAEWEYACRSGGRDQKYCGGNNAGSVAWYDDNSGNETHDVGQKQANGLGLYDMSGNVWEWVQDRYDSGYYKNSPTTNPKGASGGAVRVFRGGSWHSDASNLRSAFRDYNSPDRRGNILGFRLARTR